MPFVSEHIPPDKRRKFCAGEMELHLREMAVMLAVAEWLFEQGAELVEVHPDGMHLKEFDARKWLESRGYIKRADMGSTAVGGRYQREKRTVVIDPRPGVGDVVSVINGARVEVEAKGGCINSRHPGQLSKLRGHLYEAVGMLLDVRTPADRRIAAVPYSSETEKVARRMIIGCRAAEIEIALVHPDGRVEFVVAESEV